MKLENILIRASLVVATVIPALAQTAAYKPGVTYQSANPNYPTRNPYYFEGRIDWNLLKIASPANAWEFAQSGIHKQDDLEDIAGAIADYRTAWSQNQVSNNTCQLITSTSTGLGVNTNPPPCMFTFRLRLGHLLIESDPTTALKLFNEVLDIDPLRLGVNSLVGETYGLMAEEATDAAEKAEAYHKAIDAYTAELNLSPVTPLTQSLTYDEANNAHVHWSLAEIYKQLGQTANEAGELDLYLKATKWHSDTYAWHIQLAQKRLQKMTVKRRLN